jgi:glycosyltransferase involved in cell wall biosynthesis
LLSPPDFLTACFLICASLQLFYGLFFFRKLAFYQAKKGQAVENEGVSVVVCVRNEMENMQKLLPLLLAQQHPDFEIVVVSDRSPDDLYDWLLEQNQRHGNLKLIRVNRLYDHITPKKFALTLGIKSAKNDCLLLTDADCLPQSPHWISEMQAGFSAEKQIILGFSPYTFHRGFLNFFIRYETFYTALQYLSFALAGVPYMGVGRNLAYRRTLFFEQNGFASHRQTLGGDDDLFVQQAANRRNTAICISPESQTVSLPETTFRAWFRQKKRHLSAGKQYRWQHKIRLSGFVVSLAGFWLISLLLLFSGNINTWWPGGFFVRMLLHLVILHRCGKTLGQTLRWYELLLFDGLYAVYYIMMSTSAVFSKKIQWK